MAISLLSKSLIVFGCVMATSAVNAATIVAVPNATADLNQKIHNNNAGAGNALVLKTVPGGYFIDYSSTGLQIDAGAGFGFAQVTGSSGPNSGFNNLTIGLQNIANPTLGALAMHFKIDGLDLGQGRSRSVASLFDVKVNFVGGGSQLFSNVAFVPNDKFLVSAVGSEIISGLIFSNARVASGAATNFRSIKQVSFAAVQPLAVPEPATWAMMLAGFGLVGATVRRRKPVAVTA